MQYADSMSNYNRFVAFVLCLASEVVMSSALFDLCLNVLAIWVGCLIHRRSDAASEELRISLRQRWTAWHNIYIYIYIYIDSSLKCKASEETARRFSFFFIFAMIHLDLLYTKKVHDVTRRLFIS